VVSMRPSVYLILCCAVAVADILVTDFAQSVLSVLDDTAKPDQWKLVPRVKIPPSISNGMQLGVGKTSVYVFAPNNASYQFHRVNFTAGITHPQAIVSLGLDSTQLASDKLIVAPRSCLPKSPELSQTSAPSDASEERFLALTLLQTTKNISHYTLLAIPPKSGHAKAIANFSVSIAGRPEAMALFFDFNPQTCNYSFVIKSEYPSFDGSMIQVNTVAGSFIRTPWLPALRFITHLSVASPTKFVGLFSDGIPDVVAGVVEFTVDELIANGHNSSQLPFLCKINNWGDLMLSERMYDWHEADNGTRTLAGNAMDYNGYSPFFELSVEKAPTTGDCALEANIGKTILLDFPNAMAFVPPQLI